MYLLKYIIHNLVKQVIVDEYIFDCVVCIIIHSCAPRRGLEILIHKHHCILPAVCTRYTVPIGVCIVLLQQMKMFSSPLFPDYSYDGYNEFS